MYYIVNADDGRIIDALSAEPSQEKLDQHAAKFRCDLFVIRGEQTGLLGWYVELCPAEKANRLWFGNHFMAICPVCGQSHGTPSD